MLELMRRIGIRDVRVEVAPERTPSDPATLEADRKHSDDRAAGDPLGI